MDGFIDEKMRKLSDAMEVEIKFAQDEKDAGLVHPVYDANAIISKMIALFVYSGMNVPVTFAPSYNNVHASIELWKRRAAEADELSAPKPDEKPASEDTDGPPKSE